MAFYSVAEYIIKFIRFRFHISHASLTWILVRRAGELGFAALVLRLIPTGGINYG
jgi:hypothetical protein